jgi:hypothetical protein
MNLRDTIGRIVIWLSIWLKLQVDWLIFSPVTQYAIKE